MTDFRALCAELVELDQAEPGDYVNWRQSWNAAIARARAALAQPEPQGPTDEELDELYYKSGGIINAFARAVIAADRARWGRPAIEPVPVSERLPGLEDCDAEGRCWIGTWNDIDGELTFDWAYTSPRDWTWKGIAMIQCWLPCWALPVPGVEGADA
jgi:hypothetical protein